MILLAPLKQILTLQAFDQNFLALIEVGHCFLSLVYGRSTLQRALHLFFNAHFSMSLQLIVNQTGPARAFDLERVQLAPQNSMKGRELVFSFACWTSLVLLVPIIQTLLAKRILTF